jgi:hypothetical protein
MRSLHFAEWTLALVTSRGRATAIVGDLAERATTRGVAWFWSAVLRTATSMLWHDIAGHPARVAGIVLRGLALDLGLAFLFGVLSFVIILAHPGGVVTGLTGGDTGAFAVAWKLYLRAPTLLFPLVVGRALAHWAPGREVAACVAFATVSAILAIVAAIVFPGDVGVPEALWAASLGTAEDTLLVLAGAMWGRHRNALRSEPEQTLE